MTARGSTEHPQLPAWALRDTNPASACPAKGAGTLPPHRGLPKAQADPERREAAPRGCAGGLSTQSERSPRGTGLSRDEVELLQKRLPHRGAPGPEPSGGKRRAAGSSGTEGAAAGLDAGTCRIFVCNYTQVAAYLHTRTGTYVKY